MHGSRCPTAVRRFRPGRRLAPPPVHVAADAAGAGLLHGTLPGSPDDRRADVRSDRSIFGTCGRFSPTRSLAAAALPNVASVFANDAEHLVREGYMTGYATTTIEHAFAAHFDEP